MREFPEIDPLTIEQHPNLVAKITDDRDPNITYYLLIVDSHLYC